jgi:hypothetical protein
LSNQAFAQPGGGLLGSRNGFPVQVIQSTQAHVGQVLGGRSATGGAYNSALTMSTPNRSTPGANVYAQPTTTYHDGTSAAASLGMVTVAGSEPQPGDVNNALFKLHSIALQGTSSERLTLALEELANALPTGQITGVRAVGAACTYLGITGCKAGSGEIVVIDNFPLVLDSIIPSK